MANITAVSLATLCDEALSLLYRAGERPAQLAVGTTALATTSDTSVSFTGDATAIANLQAPAVIEMGQEALLVTAKSADATPIFTVARNYLATPPSAHAAGVATLISPLWLRFEVRRQILRSLQGSIAVALPSVTTFTATPTQNQFYVEVPAAALRVRRVALNQLNLVGASSTQRWIPLDSWTFEDDVPLTVSSTGKLVTLPPFLASSATVSPVSVYITYEQPYQWSNGQPESATYPTEAETVNLPAGAEDLPPLYAAAYLAAGREVSRLQLDKVEEWNNQASDTRGQSNASVIRMLWQEFYRRLDEARRLQVVPRHRAYRPMRRV